MPIEFGTLLPVFLIDIGGLIVAIIVVLGITYEILKWRQVLPSSFTNDIKKTFDTKSIIKLFLSEFVNRVILLRDVIINSKLRRLLHFFLFWGFVSTALATILDDIFNHSATATFLPAVISGNIGGILMLAGCIGMLSRRARASEAVTTARLTQVSHHRSLDERFLSGSTFLILLFCTTITGFTAEAGGLSGDPSLAYVNYLIHLIFVGLLLATAPFTHFFHAILEPTLRYVGRVQTALSEKIGLNYKHDAMTKQMVNQISQFEQEKDRIDRTTSS